MRRAPRGPEAAFPAADLPRGVGPCPRAPWRPASGHAGQTWCQCLMVGDVGVDRSRKIETHTPAGGALRVKAEGFICVRSKYGIFERAAAHFYGRAAHPRSSSRGIRLPESQPVLQGATLATMRACCYSAHRAQRSGAWCDEIMHHVAVGLGVGQNMGAVGGLGGRADAAVRGRGR